MLPGGGPPVAASRPAGFEWLRRGGAGVAAPGTDLPPEARKARRTADDAAGGLQAPPGAGMPETPFRGAAAGPEGGMGGAAQTVKGIAKKAPPAAWEAAGLPEDAAGAGRTPGECASPKGARKPETDPAGFGPTGHSYTGPSAIGPADCGETGRPPDGGQARPPARGEGGAAGDGRRRRPGEGARGVRRVRGRRPCHTQGGRCRTGGSAMRRRLRKPDESGTDLRGGGPPRPARAPILLSGAHGPRELAP